MPPIADATPADSMPADTATPSALSSLTFMEVLDRLAASDLSEQEKGRRFERMALAFLRAEPKFADRFASVWPWNEWPGRDGRPDNGVDIVAEERDTGELVGIQVKYGDPEKKLQKGRIDSFLAEVGKVDFSSAMLFDSHVELSMAAHRAIDEHATPITRVSMHQLAESSVDWSQFSFTRPERLVRHSMNEPRKYQREAIENVVTGFESSDRGRLVMACGTGKTFTSLRLMERMVTAGGAVLFLVPSIALLQQTLNEWTAQAHAPLRPFAVCSDSSVGRRKSEDIAAVDLGFPASTDPEVLATRVAAGARDESVTVVFSTYQSIDVVRRAQQQHGLGRFDLVICDEAHRTTGLTEAGEDGSAFTAVHDPAKIDAAKRLYMTATPRIYVPEARAKAERDDVQVFSMDDEAVFGPEFHRLGFGKAVELGHLTDYKVLVLAVDEGSVSSSFQSLLSEEDGINLNDVARIVGCWNGLAKRGVHGEQLDIQDRTPMRRAVAFASNIAESKKVVDQVETVSRQLGTQGSDMTPSLRMEAAHVDGTDSMSTRMRRLDWLKEPAGENTVRILSNARCLSEGVDVPTLDAVLFLNPRNSQVDVVQSVGRVMRKAPGKEYGYIILPIAVSANEDPETALDNTKNFKVVWDVLQALRAHDDRFEAMVNKIELGGAADRIDVIGVGAPAPGDGDADGPDGTAPSQANHGVASRLFELANAQEWKDAIFARMVRKVGDRRYWEDWAKDVHAIAERHITRIRGILEGPDERPAEAFEEFLAGLRGNLNDSITRDNAIEMLSQHLITKPVFEALFVEMQRRLHKRANMLHTATRT